MKLALALSVVANIVLAVMLILGRGDESDVKRAAPTSDAPYCEVLKKDLDFFIDGLEKKNDPFYTPLAVQTMSRLLPNCFPVDKAKIEASLAELRNHLLYLVAENTSQDQKREARDHALRIFRELRALFGSST